MFTFKRDIRLHTTIIWLFVLLTLPAIAILVVVNYKVNTRVIEDYSRKFIEKSVNDNINTTTGLLNPIINSVKYAATLMRDKPDYFREDSSAAYLHEIVASNEAALSAYASYDDGSFRQVRRAIKGKLVLDKAIPSDTQTIDRFIDARKRSNKTPTIDVYRFRSDWEKIIGGDSVVTTYDPTARSFYKEAVRLKTLSVSDVYPFASTGELGITVAVPILTGDRAIGVFAVDLTLKTLSRYLSDNRVTANSLTILADDKGGVIAHPVAERSLAKKGKDIVQNRLDKLGDDRVLAALGERLRSGKDRFQFTVGPEGTEYIAIFSPFPKDFNKPWEILTITPTDDFVGVIKSTNRNLLIFGSLVFFLQMILIYRMSKAISGPIETLAGEVSNVSEFNFKEKRMLHSRISEISRLAKAIHLLARGLESFTSYVPRGLVQQLMASGQGTRLGVESRYLTMFFTDLEGFSSLSEMEASQQLLARMSDYFSSVTSAIDCESGTVDKYIGDAVMAFWGAPTHVENHAYLACVAAVRAQRRMSIHNRGWAAQNLSALKVRIGIHSDAVLVGNIGSAERVSYTVMGDGVNVAARLEGINKEMGTSICVSHSVFREAGERLWLRPIDNITVKGRKGVLLIYELLAIRDGDDEVAATENEVALCTMTTAAYAWFRRGEFVQAQEAYAAILQRFPDDMVSKRMLEKCLHGDGEPTH